MSDSNSDKILTDKIPAGKISANEIPAGKKISRLKKFVIGDSLENLIFLLVFILAIALFAFLNEKEFINQNLRLILAFCFFALSIFAFVKLRKSAWREFSASLYAMGIIAFATVLSQKIGIHSEQLYMCVVPIFALCARSVRSSSIAAFALMISCANEIFGNTLIIILPMLSLIFIYNYCYCRGGVATAFGIFLIFFLFLGMTFLSITTYYACFVIVCACLFLFAVIFTNNPKRQKIYRYPLIAYGAMGIIFHCVIFAVESAKTSFEKSCFFQLTIKPDGIIETSSILKGLNLEAAFQPIFCAILIMYLCLFFTALFSKKVSISSFIFSLLGFAGIMEALKISANANEFLQIIGAYVSAIFIISAISFLARAVKIRSLVCMNFSLFLCAAYFVTHMLLEDGNSIHTDYFFAAMMLFPVLALLVNLVAFIFENRKIPNLPREGDAAKNGA